MMEGLAPQQNFPRWKSDKDTGVELAVEIHWGRHLKSLMKEDSMKLSMSHNEHHRELMLVHFESD